MTTVELPTFRALLKRHRVAIGLTQEELAERSHLSVQTISTLERGTRQVPHRDTVAHLADALGLQGDERSVFERAARRQGAWSAGLQSRYAESQLGVAESMVGRSFELAVLEQHLSGMGPPLLILAGEPGIGKTRLLQKSVELAGGYGWAVLQGGCQRRSGQEPFSPLVEALVRHLDLQPPAHLRTALRDCAWLTRLFPEVQEIVTAPPSGATPPEQERRLVFAAVIRFLRHTAGPAGALLVLDDLQWAGTDALDLLATLVRSAAEVPLRLIGAYRDTEIGREDSLSNLLADLAHADLVRHLHLGPLSNKEAAGLLRQLLPAGAENDVGVEQRILQRAGGVPFFVVSCAHALRDGDAQGAAVDRVPWNLAQGIRQRVAALPSGGQEVLGVAAVAGRVVSQGILLTVAEQGEERVLTALDAACRAGLLVEAGGRTYQFAHDVIHEVIESDLGAARRAVLHRRIGEALAQLPEQVRARRAAELAWHFLEGGESERALTYAVLAGDQAEAVFAHDEAERQYRTALDLACELGDAQREAGVLEKLGAVLTTRAKYDEALKLLDRAAQLQRAAGDLGAVGRVTARIGRAHFLQGTPQEGVARLEPVLELLEESEPSHSLAALYVAQASLLFGSERWSEAEEAARQASTLARAMGDERILVEALTARGEALLNQLAFEEALQVLEEAVALAERLDDLHSLTHALSGIGGVHGLRGDNALARPNFERALAVARRLGDPTRIAFLSANCAGTAIAFGDWEQARAHAEEAAEIIRVVGPSREAPYCLTTLAVVRLEQEGGDAAYRFMEECIELSERARDIQQVLRGHTLLAQHDLLAGRSEAALTRLQAPAHRVEAQWRFTLGFWLTLARAHLALGNRREAEKLLAEILTGISSVSALAVAQAHIVLAMLRTQQEAWQEAESLFDAALSSFQEKKVPFAEGHARYEWGIMYLRKGEPEKARHQLKAALAIFQRLGARSYSERTEHILSQL